MNRIYVNGYYLPIAAHIAAIYPISCMYILYAG